MPNMDRLDRLNQERHERRDAAQEVRASGYAVLIRETMAKLGRVGAADPRHVEAWMRLEHGTLDALSQAQFRAEVTAALARIDASTPAENEALAASYGC